MDEQDQLPSDISLWQALTVSWRSMRTPVKFWLVFLNGVFLASMVFWPSSVTVWTMVAYLASAPFLFGFMMYQRGLTRLLGLVHLVPWSPLVIYLVGRLSTDLFGPRIAFGAEPQLFSYVLLLLGSLGICLGLDVVDVVRWGRGERYVLGSKEAVEQGASYDARVHLDGYESYDPDHRSDRISPHRGWFTRLLLWVSERMFGQPLAGIKILGHKPGFLFGISVTESVVEEFDTLDDRLQSLITLRVAQIVGCPW